MPWSLAIHHIDVKGSGDATLIIAREKNIHNITVNFRSCLIDGGCSRMALTLGRISITS
ncbi:hypothetical protein [Ktedonospora formicarum]|uniref:Uncharacterized protein n=1 Tax=Ktedonospora formicarum TaxID=2778364 RepID=A0A8J3MYB0_9CHLR|nr:hypothetical protein [Ktedonospora formicarum]GHO50786.1 hypothetical protein KSX_89490 [Ktedonospora formicarum]